MRATLDFDFQLAESNSMIRESVEHFADEQIKPLADRIDRDDWFPRDELWQQMGELGLHCVTVSEEYGGLGLGYLDHLIAIEEGQQVTKGQKLLTLEAMKMEHGLTSPFDGTVAELKVTTGSQVQVEALLVRIEEEES